MIIFRKHRMIYSFFSYIIFCQYYEAKFVNFASNLRGFEFVINIFAKFVIILNVYKICHYSKCLVI